MMMDAHSGTVWLYEQPIDCRKSIDGLILVVAGIMNLKPQSGDIYVFYNRGGDKLKLLVWDRNGFWLHYKRLEKERFKIPPVNGTAVTLTVQQLRWLTEGLDIMTLKGHKAVDYDVWY